MIKVRNRYSSALLINLFALAHAITAIITRWLNYTDDVLLTILTIAMIVILAIRHRLNTKTAAAITFLGCFAGYAAGSYGERAAFLIFHNEALAAAITTIIITEIIGWGTYFFGEMMWDDTQKSTSWSPTSKQILAFAFVILILRIIYIQIFSSAYFATGGIHFEFQRIFANTPAVLFLICSNVILTSLTKHNSHYKKNSVFSLRHLLITIAALCISFIVAYITHLKCTNPSGLKVYDTSSSIFNLSFLRLFAAAILLDTIIYGILRLIAFASTANAEIGRQKEKKHIAQFRYNRLKTQINPHFLFNSLNILDYLVQEEETERASNFIRKLAGTYRYMLQTEDKKVVTIEEELDFVRKYIDLLKERFVVGLIVNIDLPQRVMNKNIIPCSLQLLVENATKHNTVNESEPLIIDIYTKNKYLIVTNNIKPKLTRPNSTGKGLKNIQQQYNDITNLEIKIKHTETEFTVYLPLF